MIPELLDNVFYYFSDSLHEKWWQIIAICHGIFCRTQKAPLLAIRSRCYDVPVGTFDWFNIGGLRVGLGGLWFSFLVLHRGVEGKESVGCVVGWEIIVDLGLGHHFPRPNLCPFLVPWFMLWGMQASWNLLLGSPYMYALTCVPFHHMWTFACWLQGKQEI